ncbi:MAG: type II secretion system GspH family protein [Fusobacterium sp.]|nr:type II secretion system GspH family protein [Fusobacterium sp.]
MKKAFTMSEVLIAMTVIGIVAALVVPSTFKGSQSKANSIVFKTTFAQIQQGITAAANIKKRDFVKIGENATNLDKTVDQLSKYLQQNFNLTKVTRSITKDALVDDEAYAAYSLKSGAQLIFNKDSINTMKTYGCSNSHPCEAYIDVNGKKGPNLIIQCLDKDDTDEDITAPCTVSENSSNDIFPVVFKNNHIYPGSNAVNYVLSK